MHPRLKEILLERRNELGDDFDPEGHVISVVRDTLTTYFKRAMKDVRPSIRSWLETAKNYALFANDGGLYDDLLEYLRARRIL